MKFLELRESSPSLAQTGPKRRKGGVNLTPVQQSPLPSHSKGNRSGNVSGTKSGVARGTRDGVVGGTRIASDAHQGSTPTVSAERHGTRTVSAERHGTKTGSVERHGTKTGSAERHGIRTGSAERHGTKTISAEGRGTGGRGTQTGSAERHGTKTGSAERHGIQTGSAEGRGTGGRGTQIGSAERRGTQTEGHGTQMRRGRGRPRKFQTPTDTESEGESIPHARNTFLDLKNSSLSLAQTGPKRKKGGFALTPIQATPLPTSGVKRGRPPKSSLLSSTMQATPLPTPGVKRGRPPKSSLLSSTKQSVSSYTSVSSATPTVGSATPTLAISSAAPIVSSATVATNLSTANSTSGLRSAMSAQDSAAIPLPPQSPIPATDTRQSPDLEPLEGEEGEEESGDEEAQMVTPRAQDLAGVSYHIEGGEEGEEGIPNAKPTPKKRGRPKKQSSVVVVKHKSPPTLPRSLIKNLFSLYSKRRMTRGAMDLIMKFSSFYLKQLSSDLAAYSRHAGRKSITLDDVLLLLKRQRNSSHGRVLNKNSSFEYLVRSYLPMEYVEELLPCVFK